MGKLTIDEITQSEIVVEEDTISIADTNYSFDENGNAVDDNGEVVVDKNTLSQFGVDYNPGNDGNDLDNPDNKDDNSDDGDSDKDDDDFKNKTNKDDKSDNKDKDKKDNKDSSINLDELTKIKIGDEIFVLDDDKNAVDEDGNIVHSREKLESLISDQSDDEDGDIDYISEIAKLTSNIIKDENGNEKKYDNTIEGLAERERDLINTVTQSASQKAIDTFFEENPDIKTIYEHKSVHGTIDNFDPKVPRFVSIKDSDIEKLSDVDKKEIIRQANLKRGFSEARVNKIIERSEDASELDDDVKDDLTFLKKEYEQSINTAKEEKFKEFVSFNGYVFDKDNNMQDAQVENSVYDIFMKRGKIGDLTIPDKFTIKVDGKDQVFNKEDVFHYLTLPHKKDSLVSKARAELEESLKNPETYVKFALHNLLGGLGQLVKSENNKKTLDGLRKKVKGKKPTISTVDSNDFDINDDGVEIVEIG